MKNIKLNLANVQNFFAKFSKNLGWVFFGIFMILLLFEIFEINTSLQIFLNFNKTPPPPKTADKGVRINFDNYNKVVKRLQVGSNFTPSGGITKNPFTSNSQ